MGRTLVLAGLLVAGVGVAMMLGLPLGRLPGDFSLRKGSVSFYFPLTTSVILSVVLTVLFTLFKR